MRATEHIMEEKNAELVYEFDQYVIEHPKFADNIPNGAIVAMQIEGDNEFNAWSKRLAESQAEKGQPIVYVKIKKLMPVHSRIEDVKLVRAK
jgi:hypothetical protein